MCRHCVCVYTEMLLTSPTLCTPPPQALCVCIHNYSSEMLFTLCTCVLVYLCTCVLVYLCTDLRLKHHPTPSTCSMACLLPHAMSSGYWLERVEHGVLCGLPHVPRASHTLCIYHSPHVLRRSALDLVYLCTCLKYLAAPSGIYIVMGVHPLDGCK